MVRDYDLIIEKDRSILDSTIIIWGCGRNGVDIYYKLSDTIPEIKNQLYFFDTNSEYWNRIIGRSRVLTETEMKRMVRDKKVSFIVSPLSTQIQDEIVAEIESMDNQIAIYTPYATEWLLVTRDYRYNPIYANFPDNDMKLLTDMKMIKFFFLNDSKVAHLIYQPGKVGSKTIRDSLRGYGIPSLHCHSLLEHIDILKQGCKANNIEKIKIITAVREPLGRTMSSLFQRRDYLREKCYDYRDDWKQWLEREIDPGYTGKEEFEWFEREIKTVFGIDVMQYPFDQEKGYSIINTDQVDVLIMTMEKMNDLEGVIGDFVGLEEYHHTNVNEAKKKEYRYVYKEMIRRCSFDDSMLERVYYKNPYLAHFYTKEAIDEFYKRWKR